MKKPRRKLTAAERRAKKLRKEQFQFIFLNGKKVRVRREPTIEGISMEEFLGNHADPLWLHANEMWEYIEPPPPLPHAATHTVQAPSKADEIEAERRQRKGEGPSAWSESIPF